MPSRPSIRVLAGIALLAACASAPAPQPALIAREFDLPPAVVAAVVGGALRLALPFSDPMPQVRGVLVHADADGSWRLAAARCGEHWRPFGTHRLSLVPQPDLAAPPAVVATELGGVERRACGSAGCDVDLVVTPSARGAALAGRVPRELLATIDCALALAQDPSAAVPGLEEPNLAAWARHRLHTDAVAARARGDSTGVLMLRAVAARIAQSDAALHADLCDDAERRGEMALASDQAWLAALASRDARERAAIARRMCELGARNDDANAWRAAARVELHLADTDRAAALLHTARRLHAEPASDYRLQSQLHRLRDDGPGARANALLAREHAGDVVDMPSFLADLWLRATPLFPAIARPAATPVPAAPPR